jgi:hypothetical protein
VERLGVDLGAITDTVLLSDAHGHRIWRVVAGDDSYILKWFPNERTAATEVGAYRLLSELAVPTIPVYASSHQVLLLEDLDSSTDWLLASEADITNPLVGAAVGEWYRAFHARGSELLASGRRIPDFLSRETDILTPASILTIGKALGLPHLPIWRQAAEHIHLLREAEARLSHTLNYNDFRWTNLVLSRSDTEPLRAIVFDYHLLGTGMRFCDCRNVIFSLGEEAVSSFWNAYGEVDPREEIIDRPLSTLFSLVTATRMPGFPEWSEGSRQQAIGGDLERNLRVAVELARGLSEEAGG